MLLLQQCHGKQLLQQQLHWSLQQLYNQLSQSWLLLQLRLD